MENTLDIIESPHDEALHQLCDQLSELATTTVSHGEWPGRQLEICGQAGVFRWFIPREFGGLEWSPADIVRGYLKLSSACLTTTFVITQRTAACKRLAGSGNRQLASEMLQGLCSEKQFATVGISHLTTSRRHLSKPVLRASLQDDGFVLNGFSPWVTGGQAANHILVGATIDDERQILCLISPEQTGVTVAPAIDLIALSGSKTGQVKCDQVQVPASQVVAGPERDVLSAGLGGGTGGLQTSTLALGLASAAVEFIQQESLRREDLSGTASALAEQLSDTTDVLLKAAGGDPSCSTEQLRIDANSLVLRATQAALVAAKGAGFVQGHPVGRWCQEALFFLVWSCPQNVLSANLCELAGIE